MSKPAPMSDWSRRAALQMRDRLLFDEWKPHLKPEYPGAEDELRFHMFRIFDKAYNALVNDGMESEEAITTVRVIFGSGDGTGSVEGGET